MCFFCKESSVTGEESKGLIFYDCPNCGKYAFEEESHEFITNNRDKLASFLFYNQSENVKRIFIGEDNLREKYENDFRFVSEQEIKNFYPETFSEKINMILKYVASKSRFFGDLVKIKQQFLYTFFFIRTCIDGSNLQIKDIERQIYFIGEFFDNNKFIEYTSGVDTCDFLLTSKGWNEVGEIEKSEKLNKNIFVAMSFDKKATFIRKAIKEGITEAGFNPILIDEITHNKQIVPEMFRIIRESRFLVMDVTFQNYGAYYEAGYAQGLGKEVIITCREEEFNSSDKRPHFDIAQKQILVWKNEEELIQRLSDWIKAIIK